MEIPATPKATVLKLREEHGLTIAEIASAVAVSPKTIYSILRGETPHAATNIALLRYYIQFNHSEV